jgi:hypothetical protein
MKRFLLICLCISALPLGSQARLGETEAQVEARFGAHKPQLALRLSPSARAYMHGSFCIAVEYLNGVSAFEFYLKFEGGQAVELSENEVAQLMRASGNGAAWRQMEKVSLDKYWQTEDGARTAIWSKIPSHSLTIFSAEYSKVQQERQTKIENERLKDF